MRSVKILDCTLRDGGFVNDWNFGLGNIKSIVSRLDKAMIDIIEVGFIDQRRAHDLNRSIVPDSSALESIFEDIAVENAMTVAMIDFGTCSLDRIAPKSESSIDGIRVIFKKKDSAEAIRFCCEIKKKGYSIFVQPVSTTGYTDAELVELIHMVNAIDPYAVSIVDTYGLMHKTELLHYFELIDGVLCKDARIGYHSHNNFQLAYSNSIELIAHESERALTIDGSLYGMGKGAGNANTELLAMHLNENYGGKYDLDQLLEAIDVDISKEYAKKAWGYSLQHFIAASNDCHPDYVSTLIEKKTLSVKSINAILAQLGPADRLSFDRHLLESLYLHYNTETIEDSAAYQRLSSELGSRQILVVAPGKTIESCKEQIDSFCIAHNPVVISINFIPESLSPDFVFMGNAKRYSQFFARICHNAGHTKVICTSNISEAGHDVDFKFNFNTLSFDEPFIRDNPMLMLLKILRRMKISEVYLAGFDGYTPNDGSNYHGDYIQYLFCNDDVVLRNASVRRVLQEIGADLTVHFLTPSLYQQDDTGLDGK